jgi:hypothetical protein
MTMELDDNTRAALGLLAEVAAERTRQDAKWGGPGHDDHHTVAEWVRLIQNYAGWAEVIAGMQSYDKARNRLVQVAALAVAAAEALDRNVARGYYMRDGVKVYMSHADAVLD